jgi:hypothetical protein
MLLLRGAQDEVPRPVKEDRPVKKNQQTQQDQQAIKQTPQPTPFGTLLFFDWSFAVVGSQNFGIRTTGVPCASKLFVGLFSA